MGFAIAIMVLQVLAVIAAGILLVYFIAKRIEAKEKETFEKRDN